MTQFKKLISNLVAKLTYAIIVINCQSVFTNAIVFNGAYVVLFCQELKINGLLGNEFLAYLEHNMLYKSVISQTNVANHLAK